MGVKLYQEPKLEKPVLVAGWPGIGNIGLIAVNYLRQQIGVEEFGEIEPWPFFFPSEVKIERSLLQELKFPQLKFYFKKAEKDLMIFLGERQPEEEDKIYEMANLVLDVAERFGSSRVYTAGAAVAPTHHTMGSRVWVVPNIEQLKTKVKKYENTILMSDIEGRGGQGSITGLNGCLLGVAKRRGLEGICFLGEIPIYISQFPVSYPKASKAVLEVLTQELGVKISFKEIESEAKETEMRIEKLYQTLPREIKEQLEKYKLVSYIKPSELEPLTEEDKKRLFKEIEEFLKKGGKIDEA